MSIAMAAKAVMTPRIVLSGSMRLSHRPEIHKSSRKVVE
jgi:hypothetical protein